MRGAAWGRSKVTIPFDATFYHAPFATPKSVAEHYRVVSWITLRILWRRRSWIAATVVIGLVLCGFALAFAKRQYTSEAIIQLDFVRNEKDGGALVANVDATALTESEARLIRARSTARNVVLRVGLETLSGGRSDSLFGRLLLPLRNALLPETVSSDAVDQAAINLSRNLVVSNVPRAYMITIAYSGRSPNEAAEIANSFANEFFKAKLLQANQRRVAQALSEVQRLSLVFGGNHPLMIAALANLEVVQKQVRAEQELLAKVDVPSPQGLSFTPALPNPVPSSPRGYLVIGIGFIAALLAGAGFAVAHARYLGAFASVEEAQDVLGVTCLGILRAPNGTLQCKSELTAVLDALKFSTRGSENAPEALRTLLITSAVADEGQHQIANGLADALSSTGQRVLSIDTVPSQAEGLLGANWAIDKALHDASATKAFLAEHSDEPYTKLGRPREADDQAPFLATRKLQQFIDAALRSYGCVIVAAPSILAEPDVIELGRTADATILAVSLRATPSRTVAAALRRLNDLGVRVIGIVLTDMQQVQLKTPQQRSMAFAPLRASP